MEVSMSSVLHEQSALTEAISFEDFLKRYDGEHVEWVNGKVVPMAPVGDEHTELTGFLIAIVRAFVDERKLGKVRHDPYVMKTGKDLPGRSPDILFVSNQNLQRLKKSFLDGPAELVVEVIGPDSRSRDRGEKFYEYEQGGVREYWLIDPERKQAEFYLRGNDGIYRSAGPSESGIYRSTVLEGLWLKVEWLWQRPLPSVISVLREWKLV
jgi:Uma2 family endonuclease